MQWWWSDSAFLHRAWREAATECRVQPVATETASSSCAAKDCLSSAKRNLSVDESLANEAKIEGVDRSQEDRSRGERDRSDRGADTSTSCWSQFFMKCERTPITSKPRLKSGYSVFEDSSFAVPNFVPPSETAHSDNDCMLVEWPSLLGPLLTDWPARTGDFCRGA